MAETVKVDLKNTVGFGGKLYGPGEGVEVPKKLADGLGLTNAQTSEEQEGMERTEVVPGTTGTGGDSMEGTAEELDAQYSKDELQAEADRRGMKVKRSSGDGAVRKEDLVKALASDSSDKDRASVRGE